MSAMTVKEYHESIQNAPVLGYLTWEYGNRTVHADIIEIEASFPDSKEYFVRYRSHYQAPLVKLKGNLIYFLTERSFNGDLNWPEFETKGIKCSVNIF